MTTSHNESLELREETLRRFEDRRQSTANEHVPAMSPDDYLMSLLDTEQAVREGYYSDDE